MASTNRGMQSAFDKHDRHDRRITNCVARMKRRQTKAPNKKKGRGGLGLRC